MKQFLFSMLFVSALSAFAGDRPNLLFIMVDDLGYGQCQFHNANLTTDQLDPYFVDQVTRREEYDPAQAIAFSKKAMPTLSRLATEGAHFTRAYAASSLCAPSRLAVATGRMPPRTGVFTNMDVENSGLQQGEHLAEVLHDAGYATAHIGKWHVGTRDDQIIRNALDRQDIKEDIWYDQLRTKYPHIFEAVWEAGYYGSVIPKQNPLNNGFDYYYGYNTWASQFYDSPLVWEGFNHAGRQPGYNTEVFTEKAIDFIEQQHSADKPFYVQLHYHAVHDYLEPNAPKRYWRNFGSSSYELSNFYAHVYAVDYNIQRILDHLAKNGQLENTLIAFTSDNGAMAGGPNTLPGNAPFSGHKGMFNQGGVRVPLVFYWPKGLQAKGELSHLASSMDIIPTFIEAAGLEIPAGLDARSLWAPLSGSKKPVHEQLMWAGIHARAWGFLTATSPLTKNEERAKAPGGWAVVKGDHALRFVGAIEPGLYDDMPNGAPATLALYDIVQDPAETTDIKDQHPEVAEAMKADYLKQAATFPAPIAWNKEKYAELVK